jgi:hypothetical protein
LWKKPDAGLCQRRQVRHAGCPPRPGNIPVALDNAVARYNNVIKEIQLVLAVLK